MMQRESSGWLDDPKKRSLSCNGELIRFYRAQLGWSQEELAARAGYSDRLIRKAESGQTVHADTIEVLAMALSSASQAVTPEELVSDPMRLAKSFCQILSEDEANAAARSEPILAPDLQMTVAGDPDMFPFAGRFEGISGYDTFCRRFFEIMYCPDKSFWKPKLMIHGNEGISWGLQRMQVPGAEEWITSMLIFRFEFCRGKISRIEDEYNVESAYDYFRKHAPKFNPPTQ